MTRTIIAMLLASAAAPVAAQAIDTVTENELIVTAQRKAQSIQDVPVSVTAISGATLEARSANDINDAITFAPNVAVTTGPTGGSFGGFFIRGVGQLDNSIALDPGVGVYVDDIYIARLQASSVDLLDLQRLEVLRGPQGTLFGRNTIGGAVSLVTIDPDTADASLRARGTVGSRDRYDLSVAVNQPLSDAAAVRATGFTRNQRGWGRNVTTGATFGDTYENGARIKLLIEPDDRFSIRLSGDYLIARNSPSHQVLLGYNPAAGITIPIPPPGRPFFRPGVSPTGVPLPADAGNDRSTNRRDNFASVPNQLDIDNGGVGLTITGDLGGVTLKSISGWRRFVETSFSDFDATRYVLYDQSSRLRQSQISQELQLQGRAFGAVDFLVGGFYFHEDAFNNVTLCTGTNQPRVVNRCLRSNNNIWLSTDSFAVFGQATWDITDRIAVFAGGRYTSETKRQQNDSLLDNRDGVATVLPPFAMPPPGATRVALPFTQVEGNFDAFTPRVGVNVQLADRVRAYASYSEGFKSGGFNGRPSSAQIISYDPEQVQTYEIGLKTEFFDRLLRINAAVFQSDYQNQQLLVFTAVSGLFETRNAGDSRIRGFEVEADANISERLALRASVGHLDAGYRTLSPQVAGITLDTPLPLTPAWTYSLSGEYRQPIGRSELQLRADWQYRSEVSFQLENDPLERQRGYGLLNLRATLVLPDDRFRIAAFGTNVTNRYYLTNAQDSRSGNGVAFGGIGRPAEWGVELDVRF